MSCCCRSPIPTVHVTAVTNGVGVTVFTVLPFSGALGTRNRCRRDSFNLCNPFCLPNSAAGNAIVLLAGTTTIPVETCNGNVLRVTQLLCRPCRKFLHMRLLDDPLHAQVTDCLPEGCSNTFTPLRASVSAAGLPLEVAAYLKSNGMVTIDSAAIAFPEQPVMTDKGGKG